MKFRAWRGLSEEYRRAVEGHSPWTRDVQNPEPIVVADVTADPTCSPFESVFQREKIGALGFIPLVGEGRLIGKFMVYYPQPHQPSSLELDMAQAIANHVASAIGRFAALAELQQTVRFNELFTGMLGHDLRNPLAAMMTAAQMMIRRDGSEQRARPLSRILSSGARMARMIDQLLDFTRVRVGAGIPLELRRIDIVPTIRQVVDELEDASPGWQFHIHATTAHTEGTWDPDRISQVFSNLVANAVQHGLSDQGVTIAIDEALDGLVVRVGNGGMIPAELLPKLFEPMTGNDRRGSKSHGLGLGLCITQQIVKAHGGTISVQTSEAGGTSFTVYLPRAPRARG
jgi:signal transduction histidine kinase